MSKKKIKFFIFLYLAWSLIGFYADYGWLSVVPVYFIPLTAICSLYPPLLTLWYVLRYYDKHIPQWFTFWLVLGTASYGLLALFYFPLLMSWKGINLHDVGSIFWVGVYGSQALLLFPYLKKINWLTIIPGTLYIMAADLTHYFGKTFVDFNIVNYPLWMVQLTVTVAVTVQILVLLGIVLAVRQKSTNVVEERKLVAESVINR